MKTILVPTDYSQAARNAAEYAINLAKEIKAKVLLLHAYHLPVTPSGFKVMEFTFLDLQKENEKQLKKEVARLNEKTGFKVDSITKMGLAVEEILQEGKNSSIVVMGMRGGNRLSKSLIGSIALSILTKSRKPVLVIPEQALYKDPENVVLACDYNSQTDVQAFSSLKCFVKDFCCKIDVLNVRQERETFASENAMRMKHDNQLGGLKHNSYFIENENIVEGINKFVKEHHTDIMAIIPHRYNLLDRLFHKSVSKQLAIHTNIPLLALPDNRVYGLSSAHKGRSRMIPEFC